MNSWSWVSKWTRISFRLWSSSEGKIWMAESINTIFMRPVWSFLDEVFFCCLSHIYFIWGWVWSPCKRFVTCFKWVKKKRYKSYLTWELFFKIMYRYLICSLYVGFLKVFNRGRFDLCSCQTSKERIYINDFTDLNGNTSKNHRLSICFTHMNKVLCFCCFCC